uniref:Heterogeneous nuclear ribonucleoprotein A1 n=1 Tax=Syphacia muris TaxID=451379 RepID=A0A0N5ARC6_9BILA
MVKAEENGNGAAGDFEPEQFRKMFIGGLTSSTTDDALKEYYSQWGEIVDCVVMRDPATKRSRGFGFVSYSKQSEVDAAMANRPHVIEGKTVDPKRAVPRDQSQKSEANMSSKRLYVSGVREEHTEEMFKEHFSKYGNVLKVEIIADKSTGKPRGFAFISFDDYDAVDKCVLVKSHMVHNYRCDVKKALSKEEMAKIQQQERERMDRGARSRGPPPVGRGSGWGPDRAGGFGGNNSWGAGGPGGPGGYGPQGGQWGPPGNSRGSYYGGGNYGGGGYGGYGGSAPGGGRGWSGEGSGRGIGGSSGSGSWNGQGGQGGWGPGGGPGGWQGNQGGSAPSWGGSGGQGGWGGRGY